MFTEDLTAFFNPDTPGFAPGLLDGEPVVGLFDSAYSQAFDGISTTATAYTLPSAACTATTSASLLVVGGVTYRVRSVQPDGTGISVLLLERQP